MDFILATDSIKGSALYNLESTLRRQARTPNSSVATTLNLCKSYLDDIGEDHDVAAIAYVLSRSGFKANEKALLKFGLDQQELQLVADRFRKHGVWRQGRASDDLSNGTIITVRIEYGRGRLTDLRDPATGHYNMVFGSLKAESELRALVHLPVPSRPIGHFHRFQFVRDLISAIDM